MNVSGASLLALCAASSLTSGQAFTTRGPQKAGILPKVNSAVSQLGGGSSLSPKVNILGAAVNDPRIGGLSQTVALHGLSATALNAHSADAAPEASADKIAAECRDFIASCKTLTFGLPSADGDHTELSYAPFSFEDKPMTFYVLGSQIAGASRALLSAAQTDKPATVLFMAPEAETKQMFARKRAAMQVKAELVPKGSEEWQAQIGKLRERYGKIVETLSAMPDFSLVALKPFKGRFIKGFGQAHDLVGSDLMASKPATGGHQSGSAS